MWLFKAYEYLMRKVLFSLFYHFRGCSHRMHFCIPLRCFSLFFHVKLLDRHNWLLYSHFISHLGLSDANAKLNVFYCHDTFKTKQGTQRKLQESYSAHSIGKDNHFSHKSTFTFSVVCTCHPKILTGFLLQESQISPHQQTFSTFGAIFHSADLMRIIHLTLTYAL